MTPERIEKLELLVMRFKETQGRIKDSITAALDRLSRFEDEFEKRLKEKTMMKLHRKNIRKTSSRSKKSSTKKQETKDT